jgi:hypothetical protein
MKKAFALVALLAIAAAGWMLYADYTDSTAGTAPNGEPVGAQHPKSERP